jgi:glycosyltransferase involved in cell wall biosynthesis
VRSNIAIVWDNFGPMHVDRCEALAALVVGRSSVTGVEIYSQPLGYSWIPPAASGFEKVTLFGGEARGRVGAVSLARRITRACRRARAGTVFLCHYQERGIWLAATWLRMRGVRVIMMNDSKFDDKERRYGRELLKSLYCLPYQGGLTASARGADYMRLQGIPRRHIEMNYNNISITRLRRAAEKAVVPPFPERPFLCVARLIPKKQHRTLLKAYALYAAEAGGASRRLVLCGSGPLEDELKGYAEELGIAEMVDFRGWLQTDDIAAETARAVALILPSVDEQFGICVIEALALGTPVIVSDNVGARDCFVRAGVSGFIVEPGSSEGLAFHMSLISADEGRWQQLSRAASEAGERADVRYFAQSAAKLARLPATA